MPREMPPLAEVVAAAREGLRGYYAAAPFDAVRLAVQSALRCSPANARAWIKRAVTDPEQDTLVWLVAGDDKWVQRIERDDDAPHEYAHAAIMDGEHTLWMFLDRQGKRCPKEAGVRNTAWVMLRSVYDRYVQELVAENAAERERKAAREAAAESETEDIIGPELSLIRGMFAAAGITLGGDGSTQSADLRAMARRFERDGKPHIHAMVGIELYGRDVRRLARWLREQGVAPVPAPAQAAEPEAGA